MDARTNCEIFTEELVYRPFDSVTCAMVGEFQTAGLVDAERGTNLWVRDMLLDGYDVHVWDDGHDWFGGDDADEWGRGPAHDTIVNAVNHHGQSQIALVGYSHGGGAVYNVAWRVNNNFADTNGNTIIKPFSFVFTGYIDAVSNSNFLNFYSEDRRPPASNYHLNQYQLLFTSSFTIKH